MAPVRTWTGTYRPITSIDAPGFNSCPSCGSPGKFGRQRRGDGDRLIVFIKCRICRWEQVLLEGPRLVVELRLDIEKLRGRVAAGQVSLKSVLDKREQRLVLELRKHGLEQ